MANTLSARGQYANLLPQIIMLAIRRTNPFNQFTETIYDNLGRTLVTLPPDRNGATNSYDLAGRLLSVTDSMGVSSTNYYNNQGLVYAVSNASGRVSFSIFDLRDRVTN